LAPEKGALAKETEMIILQIPGIDGSVNRLQVLNEWLDEFGYEVQPLDIHAHDCDSVDDWLLHIRQYVHGLLQNKVAKVCVMGYSSGGILAQHLYFALVEHLIEVAAVILLDPTSGQADASFPALQSIALREASVSMPQADPLSLLILASAVVDDAMASAKQYGLAALLQYLIDLVPSMKMRLKGVTRSARWFQTRELTPRLDAGPFECPVLLVSCSEQHPLFKGITEPQLNAKVWSPLCRLPPSSILLNCEHHLSLPTADHLGLPVTQFLSSIMSGVICSTGKLQAAYERSSRRKAEALAVQEVYRQRWREFERNITHD